MDNEWFVANHGGYNRRKQNREDMASSRVNMLYYQYMEPLLKKTGAGASSSYDSQSKNAKPYEQNKKWKNRR